MNSIAQVLANRTNHVDHVPISDVCGRGSVYVPLVADFNAEFFDLGEEARVAECGGTYVRTSDGLTQVERRSDQVDALGSAEARTFRQEPLPPTRAKRRLIMKSWTFVTIGMAWAEPRFASLSAENSVISTMVR